MRYVYPRLSDSLALQVLADMRLAAASGPSQLVQSVAYAHPSASPVATGGSVAGEGDLRRLRESVEAALAPLWTPGEPGPRGAPDRARFDRLLGEVLHTGMRIIPADAAHDGVWSFLSMLVFPDLVSARFPDLHESRVLGGPRNALRRVWHRREVLGTLLTHSAAPLGEDELVGLFERSALARNRPLVRALAKQLQQYEGKMGRSEFARQLYKQVRHMTGPLLLDALTPEQLEAMVGAAATGSPWPDVATESHRRADPVFAPPAGRGDLVMEFHKSVEQLCKRVIKETGHRPRGLLTILQEQGGVEGAKRVAGSAVPSETFTFLWDKRRLDLSVEALVIHPEYSGLFAPELVERARQRLEEFGYVPGLKS